jgi:hypothetical protein
MITMEQRETGQEYGTGIRDQNTVPDTGPDPMRDVPLVLTSVIRVLIPHSYSCIRLLAVEEVWIEVASI